jgi:CBS domain-containing protein
VGIGPDATIREVAARMLEQRVHRLLVLEGETLLGVLTSFDVMRVLAEVPAIEMPPPIEAPHEVVHTGYSR